MRGVVFSKNIWEGASERRNENIIVSGTLKNLNQDDSFKQYFHYKKINWFVCLNLLEIK